MSSTVKEALLNSERSVYVIYDLATKRARTEDLITFINELDLIRAFSRQVESELNVLKSECKTDKDREAVEKRYTSELKTYTLRKIATYDLRTGMIAPLKYPVDVVSMDKLLDSLELEVRLLGLNGE